MTAEMILDTRNPYNGIRIVTMKLVYPQFIHQQFLTHRQFSRNSSSLRAISVKRSKEFPIAYPTWTKEKKGMQGIDLDPIDDFELMMKGDEIIENMFSSVLHYCGQLEELGFHHQNINAYLRPFQYITTLVTATEWDNFFQLRLDSHTQLEFQQLAREMKNCMAESKPAERYQHIPFNYEENENNEEAYLVSAARCAKISYLRNDSDFEKDLALGKKLWKNKHLSCFEHIAFAQPNNSFFANFYGFQSYRNMRGY